MSKKMTDFTGQVVGDYRIADHIDAGEKGAVWLATRVDGLPEKRAVKFIPRASLVIGWENEISKVMQLATIPGVVRYHGHGSIQVGDDDWVWIMWEYIPGRSLKRLIADRQVTTDILKDVVERVLAVLHACSQLDIQHGDLHSGNVIVQNPDHLDMDPNVRKIWVTDFGHKTVSHLGSGQQLLDDFVGLNRIIQETLRSTDFHALEAEQKITYTVLAEQFPKYLLDSDYGSGEHTRRPHKLLQHLRKLHEEYGRTESEPTQNIGDYLAAEVIGERFEEWRRLFVPSFIAADKILDVNILVLTGLRGCGKTMVFRRLTAHYDLKLGPADVPRVGSFFGFYLNARSLAEAFPWLPREKQQEAAPRLMHFFNVRWTLEILDWLRLELKNRAAQGEKFILSWLTEFFHETFKAELLVTGSSDTVLSHLVGFLHEQLEASRLSGLYDDRAWSLANIDYLERFIGLLHENLPFLERKPFYLFLDDYSMPLVNRSMQEILNSVVFKRSSRVIFKVSTESIESFQPIGLNGKRLEDHDDFKIVDLGTEIIIRDNNRESEKFLQNVLQPRIERHPALRGSGHTLRTLLGASPYSFNELAEKLREEKPSIRYHGNEIFCALWSSNVREIISVFARMVDLESAARLSSKTLDPILSEETQSKVLKEEGGKFLAQLSSATNPTDSLGTQGDGSKAYGEHLIAIVKAFQEIARHELRHKHSKNETSNPPKQARRIEITDVTHDLPKDIESFYIGLVRYGIFIRDARGKSVRGKAVPRLYLRGIMVPYFLLTPSKRDSIQLSWSGFCRLLKEPQQFATEWKKRDSGPPDDGDLFRHPRS